MYELITLDEIKSWVSISNTSKDTFLETLRKITTKIIENYTSKIYITRQIAAEYHDGQTERDMMTNQYPIYKVVELYDDTDRDFGANTLVASTDYVIEYETGRIRLFNDESYFVKGVGNIKVNYWAGYSRFLVVDEQNNYLDISDGGGTAAVEIPVQTSHNQNGYSAEDLASAIETALNADTTLSAAYTVTYSHVTQKFTIAADGTFNLLWNSGTNTAKTIGTLLGFTITADDSSVTSQTADSAVTGIPGDIKNAAQQIILYLYDLSKNDESIQNVKRKKTGSGQMSTKEEEFIENMPVIAQAILDSYKRMFA